MHNRASGARAWGGNASHPAARHVLLSTGRTDRGVGHAAVRAVSEGQARASPHPPPDGRMTGPRIFTPEYYERMRQLEGGSWWNAGMRDVAARLLERATLPPRGLMLDVGCGSGQTMSWFTGMYPGWRAMGLDVAWDGVAAAYRADVGLVCVASALTLPLPDRSIDLAITLDVVQHLPLEGGDERALAELRRVVKPGGYLFVRTNAQAFP